MTPGGQARRWALAAAATTALACSMAASRRAGDGTGGAGATPPSASASTATATGTAGAGGSCSADLAADPIHCGACFNPCSPAEACVSGTCQCQPDPSPPRFASDVRPLFKACATGYCHFVKGPVGLSLIASSAYANLVSVPAGECNDGRLRVAPGSPAKSYLIDKLLGARLCSGGHMPPGNMAPAATVSVISRWICAGAIDD